VEENPKILCHRSSCAFARSSSLRAASSSVRRRVASLPMTTGKRGASAFASAGPLSRTTKPTDAAKPASKSPVRTFRRRRSRSPRWTYVPRRFRM